MIMRARGKALPRETKPIEERLSDVQANLVILWPLTLVNFFLLFYMAQQADESDLNFLSVAITLFEGFLVVSLAAGFWMLRREAVSVAEEAAMEVAKECAEQEARKLAEELIPPQALRQILAVMDIAQNQDLDEGAVNDMISKLDM